MFDSPAGFPLAKWELRMPHNQMAQRVSSTDASGSMQKILGAVMFIGECLLSLM
jgi:hypothetical protein